MPSSEGFCLVGSLLTGTGGKEISRLLAVPVPQLILAQLEMPTHHVQALIDAQFDRLRRVAEQLLAEVQ